MEVPSSIVDATNKNSSSAISSQVSHRATEGKGVYEGMQLNERIDYIRSGYGEQLSQGNGHSKKVSSSYGLSPFIR